jgi:hypothetical protein
MESKTEQLTKWKEHGIENGIHFLNDLNNS